MTIYEMELLFHFHAYMEPPRTPPVYFPTIEKFQRLGLIYPNGQYPSNQTRFTLTKHGVAYINRLKAVEP